MTNRAAAARYARALLDVSIREADPEKVERELADFVELVERHPDLEKALTNPAVPTSRRRSAVAELSRRGQLSPVVSKLLTLLAERGRLVLLRDLLDSYRQRLLSHLQVVRAEVTTAVPLSAERAKAIERGLAEITGSKVTMSSRVDSAIIGGVVARIGSIVYDGSVARQLQRMKEKLVEAGG